MVQATSYFLRTRQQRLYIPLHSHNSCEFVYFLSGQGTLDFNGKKVDFGPHTYYFVSPEISHSELYDKGGHSLVIRYNKSKSFNHLFLYRQDDSDSIFDHINMIVDKINDLDNERTINKIFNEIIKIIKKVENNAIIA